MCPHLIRLLGSTGHNVEIKKFEGPPQRGHLRTSHQASLVANANGSSSKQSRFFDDFEFEPSDGDVKAKFDWSLVKTIDLVGDLHLEAEPEIRFFDSVEVSPHLWVRLTLTDGEALEGKIDNSLYPMCNSCLLLFPLDEAANRKCVCVPSTSIATLQVVALRQ
jgi:hypothetical protein